jgi:putative addiction module component (TIGR02574 family)
MINLNEIRQLSVSERILMVEAIWDSIEEDSLTGSIPISEEQEKELEKRIARYEAGDSKTYSWSELKKRLQDK